MGWRGRRGSGEEKRVRARSEGGGGGVGLEGLRKGGESLEGDFSKSRRKTATGCGRDLNTKTSLGIRK